MLPDVHDQAALSPCPASRSGSWFKRGHGVSLFMDRAPTGNILFKQNIFLASIDPPKKNDLPGISWIFFTFDFFLLWLLGKVSQSLGPNFSVSFTKSLRVSPSTQRTSPARQAGVTCLGSHRRKPPLGTCSTPGRTQVSHFPPQGFTSGFIPPAPWLERHSEPKGRFQHCIQCLFSVFPCRYIGCN